jgi:hypothetical protein
MLADAARDRQHVRQVGRPVFLRRRSHRDKRELTILHALRVVRREAQAAALQVALDQRFQARLVDRDPAVFEAGDLLDREVHAGHFVAHLRQARRGHQTHVAGTDHTDFHFGPKSRIPQ